MQSQLIVPEYLQAEIKNNSREIPKYSKNVAQNLKLKRKGEKNG